MSNIILNILNLNDFDVLKWCAMKKQKLVKKAVTPLDIDRAYKKEKRKIPKTIIEKQIEVSGLDYPEIAKKLGIKYSANVYKMARHKNPSFKTLKMFALVLDLKIKDLVEE